MNTKGMPENLQGQRETANSLNEQAQQIQQSSNNLLNEGRSAAAQGTQQNNMVSQMQKDLPSPEEAAGAKGLSDDVGEKTQKLLEQLQGLQDKANHLAQSTAHLTDKLNAPEPDGAQVMGQVRHIEDTIEALKDQLDTISGTNRDAQRDIHKLEDGNKHLQEALNQNRQGKSGKKGKDRNSNTPGKGDAGKSQLASESSDGKLQPASEDANPPAQMESPPPEAVPMPQTMRIPGAKSLTDILNNHDAKPAPRVQPAQVKAFDLSGAQKREEEAIKLKTGLNPQEYIEYNTWFNIRILQGEKTITVKKLIENLTAALQVLTLPAIGIAFERNLEHGPILDDIVSAQLGDPGYASVRKKNPLPVKMTLLIDTSWSMNDDNEPGSFKPIEIARITYFILANALFNHNEERERKGFKPIEFEIGLFASDTGRTQISHETVREQNFKRERVLYDVWKKLVASGGTYYASNLRKYTQRLLSSTEQGGHKSIRVLFALTDEDVNISQQANVLGTIDEAMKNGARIFIVPMGNRSQVAATKALHHEHPHQVIDPHPYAELPFNIMNSFANTIRPPAKGKSWLATTGQTSSPINKDGLERIAKTLRDIDKDLFKGPLETVEREISLINARGPVEESGNQTYQTQLEKIKKQIQ